MSDSTPTAAQMTFPGADEENLSRDEANGRSNVISVSSYDVHVDLSRAAAPSASTYPVVTHVELNFDPGADAESFAFLDYVGVSVESLIVNGESRDIAANVGAARIQLTGLTEGANTVEIRSTSRFSRSGEGMHRFEDPADGQVYLYTQYEPADCRRVFPVFDQPDLKARFRFSITGPQSWALRSNGAEISRETVTGQAEGLDGVGLVRVDFAETELISSYITALLAGPYHVVTSNWKGGAPGGEVVQVDLALLCRASLAQHLDTDEIFTITRQGLDFFHQEFDFTYPWGKYDQAFVPEYNLGAMENPGLVTFTEAYVFDTVATEAQHQNRANTILHEMAHMWFGDLVTMRWWDDLWLKESFADYMGTLAVDEATEFTTAWISFANSRKGWAYVQDQLPTTHPIVADIEDLEAADQNFDGITYAKGASVLKQLAAYAGREDFRQAARQYFQRHAFSNAELEDFLGVLEEVTGKDMRLWARAWLQTSGIPVLSTEINDDAVVGVRQTGTDPASGQQVARPHVIEVGLHSLDQAGVLALTQSIPVEIAAEAGHVTSIPELALSSGMPDRLILPNEKDLTYAKLSLDPGSVAAALRHPIGDALARATVWASLWSMTRDAELAAEQFVDAVSALGLKIPEVGVVAALLRQADTACQRYAPQHRREVLQRRFAARLAEFLTETGGGDAQRAAARTLAQLSCREDSQLHLLEGLLDGAAPDRGIEGLDVDEELRWAFLQALAAHGQVNEDQLGQELDRRTTARAKIAHRLALAARPDPKVKAKAFQQALSGIDDDGHELSNDHLTATIEGFMADTSPGGLLTVGFQEEYFASLRDVWSRMSQGQATRVVRGLFPGVQDLESEMYPEEHPVVVLTSQWLDTHDDAPVALRRIIIEEQDHLFRALSAQGASR